MFHHHASSKHQSSIETFEAFGSFAFHLRTPGSFSMENRSLGKIDHYLNLETQADAHINFIPVPKDEAPYHFYHIYHLLSFQTNTGNELRKEIKDFSDDIRLINRNREKNSKKNNQMTEPLKQKRERFNSALETLRVAEGAIVRIFRCFEHTKLILSQQKDLQNTPALIFCAYVYGHNSQKLLAERLYILWETLADLVITELEKKEFDEPSQIIDKLLSTLKNKKNAMFMYHGLTKSEGVTVNSAQLSKIDFYLAEYAKELSDTHFVKVKKDLETVKIKTCLLLSLERLFFHIDAYDCPALSIRPHQYFQQMLIFTHGLVDNPKIKSEIFPVFFKTIDQILQKIRSWPENSSLNELEQKLRILSDMKHLNFHLRIIQLKKKSLLEDDKFYINAELKTLKTSLIKICTNFLERHEIYQHKINSTITAVLERITASKLVAPKLELWEHNILKMEMKFFAKSWDILKKSGQQIALADLEEKMNNLPLSQEILDLNNENFYYYNMYQRLQSLHRVILKQEKLYITENSERTAAGLGEFYQQIEQARIWLMNRHEKVDSMIADIESAFILLNQVKQSITDPLKMLLNFYLLKLLKTESQFYELMIKEYEKARKQTEKYFNPAIMRYFMGYSFCDLYARVFLQAEKIRLLQVMQNSLHEKIAVQVNFDWEVNAEKWALKEENIFSTHFSKTVLNHYAKYRFDFSRPTIGNERISSIKIALELIKDREESVDAVTLEDLEYKAQKIIQYSRELYTHNNICFFNLMDDAPAINIPSSSIAQNAKYNSPESTTPV